MPTNKEDKIKSSCLSIIELISKTLSPNGKKQANEIKSTLNDLKNNTTQNSQDDKKLKKDNYEPKA